MATALVVLALGSILAGYVGVPHALGGHNSLGDVARAGVQRDQLRPAGHDRRRWPGMAIEECPPVEERDPEEHTGLELALMAGVVAGRALPASASRRSCG